jgi:Flp pilus assembly protein TadG
LRHLRFNKGRCKSADRVTLGDQRGVYLVEFSIVALAFLLLLFGIMEFGRAVWAYSSIAHGAREGVRYAIVRGSESGRAVTASDIQTYVRDKAGLSSAQVTTTWQPDNQPGSVVQVNVNYTFQPTVPMVPSMGLTATSKMVISF